MLNVCLIQPPQLGSKDPIAFPPIGLLYIAAMLEREGVKVSVISLADVTDKNYATRLPLANYYGITVTMADYAEVKEIIPQIRHRYPKSKIILGGPYCTALPKETLEETGADYVVDGEGEYSFPMLLPLPPGHIVRTERITNLDALPFPARHLLPYDNVFNSYIHKTLPGPGTTILTSRGCPYSCAFCSKIRIMKGKPYYHSAEYVAEELAHVKEKYGVSNFRIIDDLFCCDKERILTLCDLIEGKGYSIYTTARADYLQDMAFLRRLKECGLNCLSIGVESGSDDILKRINKGENIATILQAFRNCREVGIKTHAMLIFGLPGETLDTLQATRNFMVAAKPDTWICSTFSPLPGSPIWQNPEKYGVELDKSIAIGWFFDTVEVPSFLPDEVKSARAEHLAWLRSEVWR